MTVSQEKRVRRMVHLDAILLLRRPLQPLQ